ncbi:MAG TPA: peptide deformylase [Candidatus Megaira endosymbiont of Hartmannula sinica]|nr:peptide deformylase [Candidatus Megaera endosymbiont of Hartmannula sinica]
MKLKLITAPNKILKTKSTEVKEFDNNLKDIMNQMLDIMYDNNGIGLAANQVGLSIRLLVLDLGDEYLDDGSFIKNNDDDELNNIKNNITYPIFMVNPVVFYKSSKQESCKEGCLSLPGQEIDVMRASEIKVSYVDYFGKEKKIYAKNLLARAIQHEIDHIDGVVLIDYLSKLKKDMTLKKLIKIQKANKSL